MPKEKLFAQARDELFSHINRCGVLTATDEDKTVWMDETIDYLGERYPDLANSELGELHAVGIRFCQPAINNVTVRSAAVEPSTDEVESDGSGSGADEPESQEVVEQASVATVPAAVGAGAASAEGADANAA